MGTCVGKLQSDKESRFSELKERKGHQSLRTTLQTRRGSFTSNVSDVSVLSHSLVGEVTANAVSPTEIVVSWTLTGSLEPSVLDDIDAFGIAVNGTTVAVIPATRSLYSQELESLSAHPQVQTIENRRKTLNNVLPPPLSSRALNKLRNRELAGSYTPPRSPSPSQASISPASQVGGSLIERKTIRNLAAGSVYLFRVRPHFQSSGWGRWSETVRAVTL